MKVIKKRMATKRSQKMKKKLRQEFAVAKFFLKIVFFPNPLVFKLKNKNSQ